MENPKEFKVKNYLVREVTRTYSMESGHGREGHYSTNEYFDADGKKIFCPTGFVAASETKSIDAPKDHVKNEWILSESWTTSNKIIMSYSNYLSMLCEIDRHKKQLEQLKFENELNKIQFNELKAEIDKLKNQN